MKAIGYVRVSSKSQEDGTSLEAQANRIATYCHDNGYQLAGIVSEVKSAGVNDGEVFSWENRPRLIGLMEQARSGSIDAVIVYKFDRVSRDNASLARIPHERGSVLCDGCGGQVASIG